MRRIQSKLWTTSLFVSTTFLSASAFATTVRIDTNLGDIDVELYDSAAPITVNNFLNYVTSHRYDGTFIHRNAPGFVIQGGGYLFSNGALASVTRDAPILNEYDPSRSNLRGTIAMAKLPNDPNSASSEWFFNLADNSANLDNQNGGFTVFGEVIGNGMNVVDTIAGLHTEYCSSSQLNITFDSLPLLPGLNTCPGPSQLNYLVAVNSVRALPYTEVYKSVIFDFAGNIVSLNIPSPPALFISVTASDSPAAATAPADISFNEGFFNIQINNQIPGLQTLITMELPTGFQPNTFYIYGPTTDNTSPHWYEFNYNGLTGAEFSANNVALHFVDGERGDSDLAANGQISIAGGPGIDPTPATYSRSNNVGSLSWLWLSLLLTSFVLRWNRSH